MRSHWPFAILAAVALALMLVHLGSDYLWADEGDTAVLASNILKYGVPKAWDGVTFTDSDKGARLNDDLVMVSHPWLQYYLTAASFLVFGENTFAARLPFALAGWVTILLVYIFVCHVTANRWAGFCASALMVTSVQFLLYARQCRNYALNMLCTCWLLWIFFQMKSGRHCVLFALVAILLFHIHPIGIVPVTALGILTLVYRPFSSQRRWFWLASPAIAAFTLPWLALARGGYSENTERLTSIAQFFGRFVQYLIECASVTPLIGTLILLVIWVMRRRFQGNKAVGRKSFESKCRLLEHNESALLLVTFVTLILYGAAIAMTQSTDSLWRIGIRYTTAVIPLTAMSAGMLMVKISGARVRIWLALLLVFSFTKLAYLTPWIFWGDKVTTFDGREVVESHLPPKLVERFLTTSQQLMFLGDLWQENPGTLAKTCQFLQAHAKLGDVLVTNYDWEPLYFYTRLPQALKILPGYPVFEIAQRKTLPAYVFDVDHVRWLIWRPVWEGYQGYFAAEVERQIVAKGGQLNQVAELKEAVWENRESIHFHRFSGGRYLFRGPEGTPPAIIFRVDWPEGINPPTPPAQ